MSIFSDYKVGALTAEEFADEYEACWETGGYVDQMCEMCPHNFECSGYEGEDE